MEFGKSRMMRLWKGALLPFWLFGGLLACSKTPEIKGALVAKTSVESTVSTVSSGTVEALQVAVLSFGANGRVDKIFVHLGEIVKKGQLIATLDNSDARALVEQVERDYGTAQKLLSEGLISKAALDESKKAYEVARSNFDKTQILAPFAGQISELNLQIGETASTLLASPQKVAVRIVDLKPRLIRGQIDEIDLPKVSVGAKARVRIQSVQADSMEAVVTKVIPYISTSKEQERTVQVELQITKPSEESRGLLPAGASADIEIVVAAKVDALAVPARAILGVTGKRYIFRVVDQRLKKTEVEAGVGNYEAIEVLKGLDLGEVVAFPSENVEFKDDMKVKVNLIPWP